MADYFFERPFPPVTPDMHDQRDTQGGDSTWGGRLAFLISAANIPFNGPVLSTVARRLRDSGFSTYRFRAEQLSDVIMAYTRALAEPGLTIEQPLIVGFEESADFIAREFYSIYAVRPPLAEILILPEAHPIHLNNITCPYLVLHDHETGVGDAVHHHQMRYGDPTTHLKLPHLREGLEAGKVDALVLDQIEDWLEQIGPNRDFKTHPLRSVGRAIRASTRHPGKLGP